MTASRDIRVWGAELLGTGLLVVAGVGTAVLGGSTVGTVGIALAFGFTLLALAYALAPISGCHINPAVTLGLLVAGKIGVRDAIGYVVAQVIGAIAVAGIVLGVAAGRPGYSLTGTGANSGLGTNGWGSQSPMGFSLGAVAITEVVGTFVLVFVVLATTDRIAQTAFAGIPIGVTLVVLHLLAIGVDSTSVNPARSIGPALLRGGTPLSQVWLFVVAPLAGAVGAALVQKTLFGAAPPLENTSSAVASVAVTLPETRAGVPTPATQVVPATDPVLSASSAPRPPVAPRPATTHDRPAVDRPLRPRRQDRSEGQ